MTLEVLPEEETFILSETEPKEAEEPKEAKPKEAEEPKEAEPKEEDALMPVQRRLSVVARGERMSWHLAVKPAGTRSTTISPVRTSSDDATSISLSQENLQTRASQKRSEYM